MNSNIKNISAESFEKGEEILKLTLNDKYRIVNVGSRRKYWLVGPKICEISYLDLTSNSDKKLEYQEVQARDVKIPLNTNMYTKGNNLEEDKNMKELATEVNDVKDMLEIFMKDVGIALQKAEKNSNDALFEIEKTLMKNGIAKDVADSIIKEAVGILPKRQKSTTKNSILLALKEVLARSINTCEGYDLNAVKTIMLVGPTGVGKTTTLAKLASILYSNKKDVGMITLDTYKVGASQQLKEYGNILNFEVETCEDYDELESALLKFINKDSILIDTTGKNQKRVDIDDNLRSMIDLVNPDQLSLVLSATTKTEDLYDCINSFSALDVNSIIITKLDETNTLGEIINIAYKYPKIKLAYFTNGQDVPEDIESAKSEKIINSIINGN